MTTITKTLFISDLHLQEENLLSLKYFNEFLDNITPQTEALYILGDFFEAYIGDDDNHHFIYTIAASLKKLHQRCHTRIYIMHGNRDFLIGQKFAELSQTQLLADPTVIDLYGVKTLLTHGDSLCTQDKFYQIYKKFITSAPVRFLLLNLSLSCRQKLAQYLRNKSKKYTQQISSAVMDVTESAVSKIVNLYQTKQIIHGHTHKPAVHQNNGFTRFVLPDWHPKGGMLIASPEKMPELICRD